MKKLYLLFLFVLSSVLTGATAAKKNDVLTNLAQALQGLIEEEQGDGAKARGRIPGKHKPKPHTSSAEEPVLEPSIEPIVEPIPEPVIEPVKPPEKEPAKELDVPVSQCTAKAFIEATNQRKDIKNLEIIMDQGGEKTALPSDKAYISLGHVCWDPEKEMSRTAKLVLAGTEVAEMDFKFFKDKASGGESRVATIRIPASHGRAAFSVTGKSDEQIAVVAALADGIRLLVKILPLKEFFKSKFKIYIQPLEECGAHAFVEVINQRSDLQVAVEDAYGKKRAVLDTAHESNGYATLDPICQPRTGVAVETYTVLINGKPAAKVRCAFGMEGNKEIRKADIMDLTDTVLVTGTQAGFWYNFGDFRFKVEPIKELTAGIMQSKFKFYIQKNGCEQNAVVEVQNQRKDVTVKVSACDANGNLIGRVATPPYHGTTAYLSFDTICQQSSNPEIAAEKYYKITVNNVPLTIIKCVFYGTGKLEFAPIAIQGDKTEQLDVMSDVGWRREWRFGTVARLTVEALQQSGQSKFKFFIEKVTCTQDAWVEVINQQKVALVVKDLDTHSEYDIPNWEKRGWTSLPPICRPGTGVAEKYYQVIVDGKPLATVKCLLFSDGKMATHIRSVDNSVLLRDNQGTIQKIRYNFDEYAVEVEELNEGLPRHSKFKIRLQRKS